MSARNVGEIAIDINELTRERAFLVDEITKAKHDPEHGAHCYTLLFAIERRLGELYAERAVPLGRGGKCRICETIIGPESELCVECREMKTAFREYWRGEAR